MFTRDTAAKLCLLSWQRCAGSNGKKLVELEIFPVVSVSLIGETQRRRPPRTGSLAMAFHRVWARYNHAMRSRTAVTATVLQILSLAIALICTAACTVYGERPPHSMAEATGGEGLERI